MPGPTISEVHVNRPLTNMMVSYQQSLEDFVADKVFPVVPVLKRSDKYFVIPKDAWFKAGAVERAPGTEAAGINYHITTADYTAKVFACRFDLDDQTKANFDTPLAADASAMRFVARNLMLTRELQWMQQYFQPNIWTGYQPATVGSPVDYDVVANGFGQWDTANSDPMKDVRAMQTAMQSRSGYRPGILVMPVDVFDAVCNNPAILDRIKYTQRGVLTQDLIASLFNVDKLLVTRAVLNTAQTGKTGNFGFIGSNSFLLCYAPSAPSIQDPSAGYIFTWTGYEGAGALGNTMTTFRMPWIRSDRIEGEMSYCMKQVASDLGIFGVNVLAKP